MAMKQQLKSQVDTLREENERLEEMLQQQAVDKPPNVVLAGRARVRNGHI